MLPNENDECILHVVQSVSHVRCNRRTRCSISSPDLATYANEKPISLTEISLRQNISLSYLEQLFLKLKNRNLVKSIRGSNGGYILIKPASEIKLSNIIYAVDENVKTLNCKKDSKKGCNHKSMKCITHNLWDDLDEHINSFFEKVKLEDLVVKSRSL